MVSYVPVYESSEGALHLTAYTRPDSTYFGSLELAGGRWRLLQGRPDQDRTAVAAGTGCGSGSPRWVEILAEASLDLNRPIWRRYARGGKRK